MSKRPPEALLTIMHTHRTDIAVAMAALCKTVKVVGECRDDLESLLHRKDRYADADESQALNRMKRAAKHLTQAVADLPDEMWAVMLTDCIDNPEETIALMREQLRKVA